MEKATLKIFAPEPAPRGQQAGRRAGFLEFQFNPKEVTIAKSAKWERKPAKGSKTAGPPEFSGADPCKLTVEMFFDATATQGRRGGHGGGEAVLLLRADRAECRARRSRPRRWSVLHWGR